VTKSALLRGIGADVPFDRDGRHDDGEFYARLADGDLYCE
jgi:hypothetical protein